MWPTVAGIVSAKVIPEENTKIPNSTHRCVIRIVADSRSTVEKVFGLARHSFATENLITKTPSWYAHYGTAIVTEVLSTLASDQTEEKANKGNTHLYLFADKRYQSPLALYFFQYFLSQIINCPI